MVAIITGDIENSRQADAQVFTTQLARSLQIFGEQPQQWQLYRGDGFQLEIEPENAVYAALCIKSSIKQIENLDVRMGIGLGNKSYNAPEITRANGEAFVRSGACFETLKKNKLAIRTGHLAVDESLNIMFELAGFAMNNWTPVVAEIVELALQTPGFKQVDLAKKLGKTQSNISDGLNRGGYYSIKKLLDYYVQVVKQL